jgi:glutamate synthase (ferredoxin)
MWYLAVGLIVVLLVALYDITQRKRAILRNFPIVGHFRYWLESIGPELRQYIVTSNDEERPFSRDQRRWIYASSKKENNYFGFGSDNEFELNPSYLIIKQVAFPHNESVPGDPTYDPKYRVPFAKTLGAHRGRPRAFRPASIVNVSAMSFGSISAPAVEAINRGCKIADCLQNTGEGGVAPYHQHGGELIWQIGTGYFGCRDANGRFDISRFKDVVSANPIRAIEIKLSQGAKPGMGGVLPKAKISKEISLIRGVPDDRDCISPAAHTEFTDVDSMLDFIERLADETGLPVGIKSAVGEARFWDQIATIMAREARGVDFITIDGGEGGTGAGPLVFTDHVSLPFKVGMSRVYHAFAEHDLHQKIAFIGSGKLGFPESALFAFALGCDGVNVAREAMMSIGCIQALRCHTGHCPTGVATQNKWLMRGLDPSHKASRLANYVLTLRKELLRLCHACGVSHPAFITTEHFEILNNRFGGSTIDQLFAYRDDWGMPSGDDRIAIQEIMSHAPAFAPDAATQRVEEPAHAHASK